MALEHIKKAMENGTVRATALNQCPHLRSRPVPCCLAKTGRIHIQSDETVENYCTTASHIDCLLFLQAKKAEVSR